MQNQARNLVILTSSVLATLVAGCGPTTPPAAQPTAKAAPSESHSHGTGPHGGAIGDWGGGKNHVEFTVNHLKKEATVYILGGDAKSPAAIKADKLVLSINDPSFQVDLASMPLDGEGEGKSSRFVGMHDSLGKVQEFAGTITGEIDGTPYSGDFKEEPSE